MSDEQPVEQAAEQPVEQPVEQPATPWYQDIPETWRDDVVMAIAGDDADLRDQIGKQVGKVTDLPGLVKSYAESQRLISQGAHKGKKPTAGDELNKWREEHGIPVNPSDYLKEMDGYNPEQLSDFLTTAMENDVPTETVQKLLNNWQQIQEKEQSALTQKDGMDMQAAQVALEKAWGPDFQTNKAVVGSLIESMPETIREGVVNARDVDGTALLNKPEFVQWLAQLGRKANPTAVVVPNSVNPAQTIKDELSELRDKMGTDEWYKNEGLQKRYVELLDAQQRI